MADKNIPVVDQKSCTLCGQCVDVCPENVLAIEANKLVYSNPSACTMCAACESICPEHAVKVYYSISWADQEE